MKRDFVGWQISLALHLVVCSGFVLLNFGLTIREQPMVINLSFLTRQTPQADTEVKDNHPLPPQKVAPAKKVASTPALQPDMEQSIPLPVEPTELPVEAVEPVLKEEEVVSPVDASDEMPIATSAEGEGGEKGELNDPELYVREHFNYIRNLIMHKLEYPPLARRLGWSGQVVISFTVLENGDVDEVRVVKGSGRSLLDNNALEVVARASPFPPPPVAAEIVMPITYSLN